MKGVASLIGFARPVHVLAASPAPVVGPVPRRTGWAREAITYLVALAVTVVVVVLGLDLQNADFRIPFAYHTDSLLIMPLVKATVERGSHWRNERLGAPGIQELHDFPIVDHLHLGAIWLLGRVWHDPFVVFNLFYLLTYPLTACTTLYACRRLGLSRSASLAGALLFSFLPYHYMRGQVHYFMAAYYVVPLTLMVTLWVCRGQLPFFRRRLEGTYGFALRTRDSLEAVLIGLTTASAGAYLAFFGCAILAAAGAYAWAAERTWKAAASAALVIGVVIAGGVANHAPTFLYQYENGRNSGPHTRTPEEADALGFKLANLLLPVNHHRVTAVDRLMHAFTTPHRALETENRTSSLGLVGAVGLVGLLGSFLLPARRGWPIGPLAGLSGFTLLLGSIGGIGALFAFLISPQVRAYNRVSVYLAFLALFAVLWVLDRAFDGRAAWVRRLRPVAFLALAAVGTYDQLNIAWFAHVTPGFRERDAAAFRADRQFYRQVEAAVPGGVVFNLPFVPYPEPSPVGTLGPYDQVCGYLHTDTVRWSFGSMKGREVDQWQREVATAPAPEMLRRLALRGFDAVVVDRRGYPPGGGDALIAGLERLLGPGAGRIDHPSGQAVFLDLRAYRQRLRDELGSRFDDEARRDAETVRVLWLNGCFAWAPIGEEWKLHRLAPRAEIMFLNPTDRVREIRVDLRFATEVNENLSLRIDGRGLWTEQMEVNRSSPAITRTFLVPPGRHTVRFHSRPPSTYKPTESLRLALQVSDFRMTEIDRGR